MDKETGVVGGRLKRCVPRESQCNVFREFGTSACVVLTATYIDLVFSPGIFDSTLGVARGGTDAEDAARSFH